MTAMLNTTANALRRTGRAVGRFWLQLADSAARPRRPLNEDKWSDYPRFPWF
ncbi:MAG TPA: hypothetical protein VFW46_14115 [Stellaceae bacterium]|jgi:hypothetical protein|nr:hypothetical protein [Stellaceae bacterium]